MRRKALAFAAVVACGGNEKTDTFDGSADGVSDGATGPWPVISNPTTSWDEVSALAAHGDTIYAGGMTDGDPNQMRDARWRLEARSITTGSPVAGFGNQGVVEGNSATLFERITTLVVDDTAVYAAIHQAEGWYLISVDAMTGAVRWSVQTNRGSLPTDLAVDATGLYAVGFDEPTEHWVIEKRALTDGSLVATFGTNGRIDVALGDRAAALSVVANGQDLCVAGYSGSQTLYSLHVERRSPSDGAVVWQLDGDPSSYLSFPIVMRQLGSSLFITSGWLVEKRAVADGQLDSAFGISGRLDVQGPDYLRAFAGAGSTLYFGTGYAAGTVPTDAGPIADTGWLTSTRDATIGAAIDERKGPNPSKEEETVAALAVSADALFVAGLDRSAGDAAWRIEKQPR